MKKLMMSLIAGSAVLTLFAQVRHSEPQIPVRPTLEEEGSFSMILIPDPQSQIKFAANQPLFELMTAWVAQNIDRLRIRAALFTGDMVEQNDQLTGGDPVHFHNGDQTSRQQWSAVSRALERLDGRIPYIVCQGNHDVGYVAAENRLSMMPQYIYPERNTEIVAHLAAAGLNHENVHTLENAAYEFHDAAWGDLLVIAFEFAPRDEALDWARGLIESEKYRNHRVIVLTHSFLDTDGSRKKGEGYKLTPRNWPQAVWEKLVYPSKNICLVLCGHTGTPPKIDMEGGADGVAGIGYRTTSAYRVDRAADGRRIPQMMFNSQAGDGGWFGNGGDCWLRILEFRPDGRTIGVRTFSPLFALSRITARNAWRTADYDREREWMTEAIRALASEFPSLKIALEYKPKEPRNFSYHARMADTILAAQETGCRNVGVTIDTGHGFVGGENVAESIVLAKRAGDRLFHMHFNDNHGCWDDDMIVSSVHMTTYIEMMFWLRKTGYDGWLSMDQ